MPDDPEQQGTPSPLTTAAQLAGIAREALVASTGQLRVAAVVREALMTGIGFAGRMQARSSAKGSLNLTTAGLTLSGKIAATSAARTSAHLALSIGGTISAASAATGYFLEHAALAGRIATMASAQMLTVGQVAVAGRIGARSTASAALTLQNVLLKNQYCVTINTG